jgi:aryl-alcohol dehydrogenase-like predicted oxidoreductase
LNRFVIDMIRRQPFGRTGHDSSATIFGAAALGRVTQDVADSTLSLLDRYCINHIDVAASYGDAELRIGPWMEKRRGDFFLATKTEMRSYTTRRRSSTSHSSASGLNPLTSFNSII